MKRLKLLFLVFILLIPQIVFAEDVYDVILFFGQSNMLGTAGKLKGELKYDARVTDLGISGFAQASDIKMSIIKNYTSLNHVDVPIDSGILYEYRLSSNQLVEINSNSNYMGEDLYPVLENNKVTFTKDKNSKKTTYESFGTNMIPQFAYTYNKLTGHKVIAVFAATSNKDIASFLPEDMIEEYGGSKGYYIYEEMTMAYKNAIKYLNDHNMKIGNKFYVAMQGESDVRTANKFYLDNNTLEYEIYYNKFKLLHDLIKNELDLSFGVIAETAYTLGTGNVYGVEVIHSEQENLAIRNDDIIIGSSFVYKHFIPTSKYYDGKISYSDLFTQYSYSTSVVGKDRSNMLHLNSAALSQIGDDCANQAAAFVNKSSVRQEPVNLENKIFLEIGKSDVGNWKFDLVIGFSLILLAFGIHLYQKQKSA